MDSDHSSSASDDAEAKNAERPAIERTNRRAQWSLGFSFMGLAMVLPIVGSILGIVGGRRAIKEIDETGEGGGGIAEAAIIFGWFGLITATVGIVGLSAILIAAARS